MHTVGDVAHFEHSGTVMVLAIAAGVGGLVLGWVVFSTLAASLGRLKRPLRGIEVAAANKFFFDELYREVLLRPTYLFARLCGIFDAEGVDGVVNLVGRDTKTLARVSGLSDAVVVDGAVNGVGTIAQTGGRGVSRLQNGRVRFYLSLAIGVVALLLVWKVL